MKDLRDPDDWWAIAKDFPPCGECLNYKRGWCLKWGMEVTPDWRNDSGCYERD